MGTTTVTSPSGARFALAYADDFSAGALDTGLWGNPFGGGLYWNGAFRWSASDVKVADGRMVVSATRQPDGSWTAGGVNMLLGGNSITYGRVEFDARFDKGQGTGAAILLWPTSNDTWPPEIDLIETPRGGRDRISFTNHWPGPSGEDRYRSLDLTLDASQWHRYTLDWTPAALDFYVDGVLSVRLTENIAAIPMSFGVMSHVAAPFENWYGGGPDATTPAQVNAHLDNVRIYRWLGGGSASTPPAPVALTLGSGSDALVLRISQDMWLASAQYTVSVDGKQIGGALTASAWHGTGQSDTVIVRGNWAAGAHSVTVRLVNDDWGGTAATDRNLHIEGATYNGKVVAGAAQAILSGWQPGGFTVTDTGTAAAAGTPPPVRYGPPNAWTATADVAVAHLDKGGTAYLTFAASPDWGTAVQGVRLGATTWKPAWATHLAFDNFVQTNVDLRAVSPDLDLLLLGARTGTVLLGGGDDHVTWVAQSDGGTANQMTIWTGGGDDTVRITAAGLSPLDTAGHGPLYDPAYDGRRSVAVVRLGDGQDSVAVEGGLVRLVAYGGTGFGTIRGGAGADLIHAGTGGGRFSGGAGRDVFLFERGDGPVVIEDFARGTDRLKLTGLTAADLRMAKATEGGVAGLRITYDEAGDSVFLAHVTTLAKGDLLFG